MNIKSLIVGMMAVGLLAVGGCSQKGPATAAIAAAESALAPIKDNAAKFLPDELHSVEAALTALKDSAAKGDYKAVVTNAPAVTSSIDTLNTHVAGKLVEAKSAAAEWRSYATELPSMVQALQSRVDILSAAKTLPKGMDKAALTSATGTLDSLKADWTKAVAAFDGGNPIEAVSLAKLAKEKGDDLLAQLGMKKG